MTTSQTLSRITTWGGIAVLSLTLAACGGGSEDQDTSVPGANAPGGTAEATTPGSPTSSGSDAAAGNGDFTAENGMTAIATAEADGGVVHELDRTDDDSAWDLDVVRDGTEYDVVISPDGTTVQTENDRGSVDADDQAEHDAAGITITEAIEAAAAERDEPLEGASLDEDDGTLTWGVEFETDDDDLEVRIDAADGTVLGTES